LIQKHRINPDQLILQLLQSVITHRHLSNTYTPVGTYLELIDDDYVRVTSWTSWRSIEHNSDSAMHLQKQDGTQLDSIAPCQAMKLREILKMRHLLCVEGDGVTKRQFYIMIDTFKISCNHLKVVIVYGMSG